MLNRRVHMITSAMLVIATSGVAIASSPILAQEDEIPPDIAQLALDGVETNDDWNPYVQEFDSVEMMLVPAGCFTMGTTDGQADDDDLSVVVRRAEQPASQQCFDQPFWIDKYEVTNVQFAQLGGVAVDESRWNDDTRPRETIDWFESRDFCELRGGYLPSEAEWEYAARGPDSLIYPWGNAFVAENAFYRANSDMTTAEVGSKPDGASWVGALDMSGNVGEWTSSMYTDYPYDATDGRENNIEDRTSRVLRGGSHNQGDVDIRAAARTGNQYSTFSKGFLHGVRCARSFDLDPVVD